MSSTDDLTRIAELINTGASVKEVSTEMGISLQEVRNIVEAQGWENSLLNRAHWKWDEAEDQKLIELWTSEEDPNLNNIASIHRRSAGAIASRVKHLIKEGYLAEDLKPKSNYKKWTATEVKLLKEQAEAGTSWVDIAANLERSEASVKRKHERLMTPPAPKTKTSKAKSGTTDMLEILINSGSVSTVISIPRDEVINIKIPQLNWGATVDPVSK